MEKGRRMRDSNVTDARQSGAIGECFSGYSAFQLLGWWSGSFRPTLRSFEYILHSLKVNFTFRAKCLGALLAWFLLFAAQIYLTNSVCNHVPFNALFFGIQGANGSGEEPPLWCRLTCLTFFPLFLHSFFAGLQGAGSMMAYLRSGLCMTAICMVRAGHVRRVSLWDASCLSIYSFYRTFKKYRSELFISQWRIPQFKWS